MGFFSDLKDDLFQSANAAAAAEQIKMDAEQEEPLFEPVDIEEMDAEPTEEAAAEESEGTEPVMGPDSTRVAKDETSVITAGMVIKGDISTEGSIEVVGTVNGNIEALGNLNITGCINGNSTAAEVNAEGAKICGEIVSEGNVKVDASSVVIGNITATGAVIAGAVKGDIDVKGPVVLEATAMVMGNIKSKSVQIGEGAGIEGMCLQCYAEVRPSAFFDDYKA